MMNEIRKQTLHIKFTRQKNNKLCIQASCSKIALFAQLCMLKVLSLVSYQVLPAKMGGQKDIALFHKSFSKYAQLTCVTTRKNDKRAAEGYEVLNILSDSRLRYVNPFYFFTLRKLIRQK